MLTHEERVADRQEIEALAAEICTMAGHINAANYRFLKLIAEFDRRSGWSDSVTRSCAHWLNWKCGIALGSAREKVRTAHALEQLPMIAAAMERGQLSYSKVRAITRVATPATEETLLGIAIHGTATHVEMTVQHFRPMPETEELTRAEQQDKNREVTYRWDDDGSLLLSARLPAEIGALVLKALEGAMKDNPARFDMVEHYAKTGSTDVPAGTPVDKSTRAMQRADALGLLAESFLQHGSEAMHGADRHQIVIHVAAETLQQRTAGCCELEDGPSLPAETVRRLACDASLVPIIEDEDGNPLNVGRKTRSISTPLRRALNSRDRGCRFPGCTHKRYMDVHHIHHWANGGETRPENLVSLCRFHHRKVHEGGITVQILDDGALRFVKPDGTSVDSIAPGYTQPLSDWSELPSQNERHSIRIDRRTAVTRWDGVPMDYGSGVQVLLHQASRERRVQREHAAEGALQSQG
jgi:Domain of unknown function (DUF222)/HNH endonuclease